MDISIIIINYRTPQLIINCLDSIYKHTTQARFEIIVVDNDPANGGGEQVRDSFPGIQWIDMPYNAGFGRANNAGMAVAKGRYFLLLNADTLVTDNVIDRCMRSMDAETDVVAGGAIQRAADGAPMPFYQSTSEFLKTFFIVPPSRLFNGLLDRFFPESRYSDSRQKDWLIGAFMIVRADAVRLTGGFDEDFFMYAEDVEWSMRLSKLGKLCYFPDCSFIHLENDNPFRRTNISWINRFSVQMQVSNLLWVRKQYGAFAYLGLIFHYTLMIPVVYGWKMIVNIKNGENPFSNLKNQSIYTRKTAVLLKYFLKTLLLKKGLYRIKPSENIDFLTAS